MLGLNGWIIHAWTAIFHATPFRIRNPLGIRFLMKMKTGTDFPTIHAGTASHRKGNITRCLGYQARSKTIADSLRNNLFTTTIRLRRDSERDSHDNGATPLHACTGLRDGPICWTCDSIALNSRPLMDFISLRREIHENPVKVLLVPDLNGHDHLRFAVRQAARETIVDDI